MKLASTSNRYFLLNAAGGWRSPDPMLELKQDTNGVLTMQLLPGQAQPFLPDLTNFIRCPAAVACDSCGNIFILDAGNDHVIRIDSSQNTKIIAEFGGNGSQPRQLRAPRGIAVTRDAITITDTANNRVQIFSPPPHALIQLWQDFHWPWGIHSDACGNLYISDRGNHRIQKIARDGTFLCTLGEGLLTDPTEIAVGPQNQIAVVDTRGKSASSRILILAQPNIGWACLLDIDQPRSVTFDADGNLYVGSATGLVYCFTPDSQTPANYLSAGVGVSGLDASLIHMRWITGKGLITIAQPSDGTPRKLWVIPTSGDFARNATLTTETIDSGMENCPWDRVTLIGNLPTGTSVCVDYYTSNNPNVPLVHGPSDGPAYLFKGDSTTITCNDPLCGDPSCADPDCQGIADQERSCLILAQPGQFLRLKLTFKSNGRTSPSISGIKIYFPRQSYIQYLASVYQDDPVSRDFLDRLLSLFQSFLDSMDARIDKLWQLFDPNTVPPQFYNWLAAWLDFPFDPTWDMAKKRLMLKKAMSDYRVRGTVQGIMQAIKDNTNITDGITLIEHFRLRKFPLLKPGATLDSGQRLWSKDFYQRLQVGTYSQVGGFLLTDRPEPAAELGDWGANEFSVYFPADPYQSEQISTKVAAVVNREKPAHAKANFVPVLPRFRIGVQSTLGIDSTVGGYTQLLLNKLSTLGYDTILACSPAQRDLEKLGTTVRPAIGVNSTLY